MIGITNSRGSAAGALSARRRLRVVRLLPALDYGGVESRVTLQARLHECERIELRVCAFHCAGAAAQAIRESNVPVDVLDVCPSVKNPRAALALARYLARIKPDLLHTSIVEANFHALAVAGFCRVPVVVVEETGMPSHGVLARLAFSVLYRRAAAIVGVTEAVCDYAKRVDRAPPDRVELVYNCADPKFFPEARHQPAFDLPKRFLAVGRLVPVKNQGLLLVAFAATARQHPDAELWIAGDGPLRGELGHRAQDLGIQDKVRFLGYQSDIRGLLTASRAFVLPSLSEGCSISLIEAMATGVAVLGSDVSGIREVMGEALATEWTAPPDDCNAWSKLLCKALDLPTESRRGVAQAAQERAYSIFSPVSYVRRVEKLYQRLASGGPSEPVDSSS